MRHILFATIAALSLVACVGAPDSGDDDEAPAKEATVYTNPLTDPVVLGDDGSSTAGCERISPFDYLNTWTESSLSQFCKAQKCSGYNASTATCY
jgi:hypothetical protein